MAKKADESTAIVTATRAGPLTPSRQPGETGKRLTSSYNPADQDQRKLAVRAALNQDVRAEDVLGKTLNAVHWVTMDASRTNPDTGEVEEFVRTVLVEDTGNRVSAGSDWIIASIMVIESLIGPAPWNPPLAMRIVAGKSRQGHTFYSLDLV